MDIKNVNDAFDDDFADIFNNAEEMEVEQHEISQESFNTCIRLLETKTDLQERLDVIQKLVNKFLPTTSVGDIDEKLLRYLLPAIKEFLNNVFDELCQIVTTINLEQKSVRTLNILQNYLQMCVIIYESLNIIFEFILQNQEIQVCKIRSLPLNAVEILFTTFQHCKQSDKFYKIYFEDLKEIFSIFKGAQDVHIKLLKLLEKHVDYSILSQEEIGLLKKVLETLSEIGSVLVDMNIKALADNWKGYLALTQKLSEQLKHNNFDIEKPMQFLSKEITRNINNVLKMDVKDQKGVSQILKICNFFIRIFLKLCETFWENLKIICESILVFLSDLHEYYPPFLEYKGYSEVIVKEIEETVFEVINQVIKRLIDEPEFYQELTRINTKEVNATQCLFLYTMIFQNIASSLERRFLHDTSYLINIFLKVIQQSYCELFYKVQIPTRTNQLPTRSVYNENVINITHTIISANQDTYRKIAHILLRNILQDCVWTAVLATDIWCLYLRNSSSQFCYETLLQILVKTKHLLLNNLTSRPERVYLENFLKRLYSYLSDEHKCSLLEKFPPLSNLHIWKCLGFEGFPQMQFYMVELVLINIAEKMESFKMAECNVDGFNFLCNGLEAVSTLFNKDDINLTYVLSTLTKLWDFDDRQDDNLYKNALFKHFIGRLLQATNSFILNFNNQQTLLILLKLKHLLNCDVYDIKIRIGQTLTLLSTKSFKPSLELTQIITTLSDIFVISLQDKNPIIRQNILEVFVDFLNATPHEEIIHNAVKSNIGLQHIVSNFVQKNIEGNSTRVTAEEYYKKQRNCKFLHVCPLLSTVPKFVKLEDKSVHENNRMEKFNEEEVAVIITRIKADLQLLHNICDKENLCEENVNDIVNILSKKIGYRF